MCIGISQTLISQLRTKKKGGLNIVCTIDSPAYRKYPAASDLSDSWLSDNEDASFSLRGLNSALSNITNIKGKNLYEHQRKGKACTGFS